MSSKWDNYHKTIPPWESGHADSHLSSFLMESSIDVGGEIIDLGCGGGINTRYLYENVKDKHKVLGIDISSIAIDRCLNFCKELDAIKFNGVEEFVSLQDCKPSLGFLEADLMKLNGLEENFSFVFDCQFFHALINIYKPRKVARKICSLLKRNGILFILCGNSSGDAKIISPGPTMLKRDEILNPFLLEGLELISIEETKFDSTKVYGEDPPLAWKVLFRKPTRFSIQMAESKEMNEQVEAFVKEQTTKMFLKCEKGEVGYDSHSLVARLKNTKEIIGGVEGYSKYGGTYVNRIIVKKEYRNFKGVGKSLINGIIQCGKRSSPYKASICHLFTFNHQAPLYYPKIGFKCEYELDCWSNGRVASYFSMEVNNDTVIEGVEEESKCLFDIVELTNDIEKDSFTAKDLKVFLKEEMTQYSREAVGIPPGFFNFSFYMIDSENKEEGNKIVGVISGEGFWSGMNIYSLFVHEDYQSFGLEKILIDHAINYFAEARQLKVVLVDVFSFQPQVSIYSHYGFKEIKNIKGFHNGESSMRLMFNDFDL